MDSLSYVQSYTKSVTKSNGQANLEVGPVRKLERRATVKKVCSEIFSLYSPLDHTSVVSLAIMSPRSNFERRPLIIRELETLFRFNVIRQRRRSDAAVHYLGPFSI